MLEKNKIKYKKMDNDKLILPFDKCYCLHLSEDKERYLNILTQFKKLGIKDQVEIRWTCKRPISIEIGNNIDTLRCPHYDGVKNSGHENVYAAVFNCAFEHYTIIKQAYLRGFNSVLIMEDDIIFHKNKEYYIDLFNNLPEDWDILRLGYDNNFLPEIDNTNNNYFIKCNEGFPGACMNALSRRGMEYYIKYMDDKFEPGDNPFIHYGNSVNDKYKPLNFNVYVTPESIVKVWGFRSTITDKDRYSY